MNSKIFLPSEEKLRIRNKSYLQNDYLKFVPLDMTVVEVHID
jgi:hypothetical protein